MTKYYPKKDYSSNLVAKWIFDDTNPSYANGNTIYDLSGKGNNLTAYNVTYKDDVDLGRCAYFNGTNAYCKSMKNISNGKISLIIKFKQTGLTDKYQTIISPQTATNGYMSGLYVYIHKDTGNIVSEYSVSRFSNWLASTRLLTNTENIIGLNKSYDITFIFNNIKNDKNGSQVFINNLSKIFKNEVNEVADNIQYLMTIGKHSSENWYYNGYIQSIEIYDEAIEFVNNNYLIQDKNNVLYTLNENNLIQAPSQTLDEYAFINNGFTDTDLITKDLLLSKFENLEGIKLLVYTDNLDKKEYEMIYNCEPNAPKDKLKIIGNGKFEVLMKEI
ncbi:hypothetical protein [Clostridium botulinum]|uniref:hypothetical protein n=1 Tax=Clostridium botulinum TaxID=1491 RepID=UPI001FAD6E49|nr:hypothetical protein [Clostridium botulinum]